MSLNNSFSCNANGIIGKWTTSHIFMCNRTFLQQQQTFFSRFLPSFCSFRQEISIKFIWFKAKLFFQYISRTFAPYFSIIEIYFKNKYEFAFPLSSSSYYYNFIFFCLVRLFKFSELFNKKYFEPNIYIYMYIECEKLKRLWHVKTVWREFMFT